MPHQFRATTTGHRARPGHRETTRTAHRFYKGPAGEWLAVADTWPSIQGSLKHGLRGLQPVGNLRAFCDKHGLIGTATETEARPAGASLHPKNSLLAPSR
jgi:hypothetical protein